MNTKNYSILDTAIGFQSQSLNLEGIVSSPRNSQGLYPALLICHPHPMFGGNMDNPVVKAICLQASSDQFVCLRFNFRGVGESEGRFDNGIGEQQDLRSALSVLKNWHNTDSKRIGIVGYSFGATVILDAFKHCKIARSFALIAPSISSVKNTLMVQDKRPCIFLAGENDKITPPTTLKRELHSTEPDTLLCEIPNADHSLAGSESAVAEEVVGFLKKATI